MSCIWVSAQSCSQQELFELTELIRKERDMQIIVSCEPPVMDGHIEATEEKITDLLVRLGIRPNLKGYQYLKTAVILSMKDKEELDGITKRLYPSVARKHAASADKVEHAIRHAIRTAWEKGNETDQKAVFGYCFEERKRPTNSEFIMQVIAYMEKMNRPLFS